MSVEWERPQWEECVNETLARLEHFLPSTASSDATMERRRYFQRIATLLMRYGENRDSPIQSMLGHIGNYWRSGIVVMLRPNPLRPSAIRNILTSLTPDRPISQRMLTLSLRALERDGIIEREVYQTGRAHVEYRLTRLGFALGTLLLQIVELSEENFATIAASRKHFDARHGG